MEVTVQLGLIIIRAWAEISVCIPSWTVEQDQPVEKLTNP